ncbi:MAG: site-specific integrase [Pseudonocardiaceae bacterium]
MARPPLALGTHGKIKISKRGDGYIARCRYRDVDGTTRQVERGGASKTAANRNLQEALRALRGPTDEPLRPEHRFERAAKMWLVKVDAWVADGELADTTADRYRQRLDSIVLPAIGKVQLWECTVGRIDTFFARLAERGLSAETRRGARTVVSGVLRQAVLHEALAANPVRELGRIRGKPSKPRALTPEERHRWLQFLATDPAAVRRDLHDLSVFMLGTGVRIGEALALRERDVDLEGIPVDDGGQIRLVPIAAITGNIVYVRGKGLVRHDGKTETSLRIVPLPSFVSKMLTARDRNGDDAPVFPARQQYTGEPTWKSPHNVTKYIREARIAAKLSFKLTSHIYRKTAATIWNDAIEPPTRTPGFRGETTRSAQLPA